MYKRLTIIATLIFTTLFMGSCVPPVPSIPTPPSIPIPQIPQIPIPPISPNITNEPQTQLQNTSTPSKEIEINMTVTVPYWTTGDIYLGTADNLTLLKLTQLRDVIYSGNVKLLEGYQYFYSRGSLDTKEVPLDRKAIGTDVFDAVIDWSDSSKSIIKEDFQKGFYIGAAHNNTVSYTKGNFIEPIKKSYDEIKKIGGNWVNLVPVWFIIPDYTGNELKPIYAEQFQSTSGWVHATIKDEDLITLINEAHARNLNVYLSPHVAPENWGPGVKGKGDLEPSNPDLFFASYKNFINHYADIAQQTGVEQFSVGNELDTLTQEDLAQNAQINKTARWRDVIKSVREHYNGVLTYSVSAMDEVRVGPELIMFWDDLDVIGWEWYVPIATKEHESVSVMKANAERIIQNHMKPLYEKYGKPIIITEIGWEAYPGAGAHTYGTGPSKGGDRVEQASDYEAIFQAIENVDFIKGMHIWTWSASKEGDTFPWVKTDSANEVRFSITEKEIAKWYSKIEN